MSGWGGRRAQAWTRAVLENSDGLCALRLPGVCTVVATTGDHVIPQSVRPDLRYVVANGRPSCGPCNNHRQAEDLDDVRERLGRPVIDTRAFFDQRPPGSPAPSFRFLPTSPNKTEEPRA